MMPTLYEFLVFIHILTAVIWVGGAVYATFASARARRSDDPGAVARMMGDAEWIGTRVFAPASFILLLSGIYAVIEGPWEFSQAWISIGLTVWILSFIAGIGFFAPESKRIVALATAHGSDSPEVRDRVRRLTMLTHIELLLLVIVIYSMVTKPGL